jgi:uroporphyrinogen-III synthase
MSRPLAGRHIVNTRAAHQAAELDRLLQELGAVLVPYPCIDIAPPQDTGPLDEALRAAGGGAFDWLVLTSANTVLSLSRRLDALELPASGLSRVKIAAVGPATAESARDLLGLETSLLPDEYVAESLVEAFNARPGTRVLLPQSDIARPVLADGLAAAGLDVAAVAAYRTVMGGGGANVPPLLKAGQIDVVTFTSSSTVEYFLRRVQQDGGDLTSLNGVCVACIGPVAARTAHERGLMVAVIPDEHTLEGLVAGLETYFLEARIPSWPRQS